MNKIVKTFLVLLSATITTLVMPIFGQWYYQTTGIIPFAFYGIAFCGGIGMVAVMMDHIWND